MALQLQLKAFLILDIALQIFRLKAFLAVIYFAVFKQTFAIKQYFKTTR